VVAAVGAILLVPHVVNGGFHADDWVDAARYAFPRNGSGFWASYENSQPYNLRDAYGLLRTAEFALLGTRTAPHLALTAIAAVAQAMLMLLLARRLGAPAGPATMLGLLVLLLPAADSNRFWGNGLQLTLFAGAFVLAGVLVALRGLEARRWKGWALHAGALVLFAASVNGYELAAPVIVLAGFLYVGRAPLRVALMRWSADIVVVGAVLLRYAGQRDDGGVTLRESLDHARVIGDHGLDVAARALVPVPGVTTGLVLVIAAVVVASALPGALGRPRIDRLRSEMRLGLGAVGAGVVLAGAGWLMIVPADMGYDPIAGGIGNRVNTVASFGLAVLVAGIAVIIAAWVRAAMAHPR